MKLKYLDGLMGFVVGDVMGFPLVNKSRDELLKHPITKMVGNDEADIPIGTWSDVTSLLIATIDSINAKCDIDLDDMATKYVMWKNHADYTPYKEVLNIRKQTEITIAEYDKVRSNPTLCGLSDINDNDNNSLMRILPIAYYAIEKKLKDYEVIELVRSVSSITHRHEISIIGCYIYVRFVMFLLNGKDKFSAYSMTKCVDYTMFDEECLKYYDRLLVDDIGKLNINDINSSDNIVDSLEAAIWVLLKSENYKEAIIGAINLGEDTNTIAALAGALAGIVYGYQDIPENWVNDITKKDYLLDIFEEFSENKYI